MKSLTYSKKYEKASLLSRIKLTGYVYAKKVFGKFKFNYVLDLLNETLNFGSIFTLELTLMLMATGYLKTSWYFIVSTCYPIILGSIIYTVIFGSIIISKDTMSSTLYLMVETVQVSIIILLSYLLPIGTFYNLNFTFIFYYILINFCSKALFHFLDMKKLINYSFNGICSIFRSSAKNNEFFSDQELKKLNEYNFNLLLAMTTIVILLPLNIISINRLLILSCIIHIGVNISASFSNKDRNKNINKKNILENPTPYPILITISSITGITTLALVFTKFSILHQILLLILNIFCDLSFANSINIQITSSSLFAIGIIAAKIMVNVVPILLDTLDHLLVTENVMNEDTNKPKNFQMNLLYYVISHVIVGAVSILNFGLLFENPKQYFARIMGHSEGIITKLWHFLYLNIVIPFKVYILGDTSALTSFWRDYSNATLSIKTESNQHLETTSFVYAIKTKVERPYAKYGELTEWEAIAGPVDNTQSTKEYTFYVKA